MKSEFQFLRQSLGHHSGATKITQQVKSASLCSIPATNMGKERVESDIFSDCHTRTEASVPA